MSGRSDRSGRPFRPDVRPREETWSVARSAGTQQPREPEAADCCEAAGAPLRTKRLRLGSSLAPVRTCSGCTARSEYRMPSQHLIALAMVADAACLARRARRPLATE